MNPLEIYQTALNVVSDAVLVGNFDRYAAMIDLPYLVHTETARLLVTRREDLRPTFDALHETLRTQGVTHYERVARAADYVDRGRIEGWHHTHLIASGERLNYPHVSRHTLVLRDGDWRFSEAHYAIKVDRWPVTREVLEAQFGVAVRAADDA
ncbi:hypothetical protein [Tabrizicola sp.]|uniref:hypothetical protein n=1 Tax=Tabrizicola sp. TaxID=2005166 RepID=UPI0027341E47|nr:hypothetical protein [Tabrizicola sp.]MDP3195858.1 hypothetical protein [Tabrizicola sp.]